MDRATPPAAVALLGPEDPPPFEWINPQGAAPILLTCDHASRRVPAALGTLGLDPADLAKHIGWDIGAGAVVRRMAALLDAPAVVAGYSRLVIDLNRPHDSTRQPGSIPEVSDHIAIPANEAIAPADAEARARAIFRPYHDAIEQRLDAFAARGVVPAYVAMHSFTPEMEGVARPWHVAVCWEHDPRIPKPLIAALRARPGLLVGDNEPYAIELDSDYGIPVHAAARGLPHVLVEIRQDQIADDAGAGRWAEIMTEALGKVLADPSIFRIEHYA